MIRNKKKGFTLVELLAVIVILAIILVIAVPQIMSTIENARKGSLESTAKLITSGAEKRLLENETLGITKKIKCEDVVELDSETYGLCKLTFDENGNASVIINGAEGGKFDNMACSGTKNNITCEEGQILPGLNCTYDGELVEGAEFTHNQYTYRYKQEYIADPMNMVAGWVTLSQDGWGVVLTDKSSTDPVNTPVCSYINGKPLVSTSTMFGEVDAGWNIVVSKATSIDVSEWDTDNVTNMQGMFAYASATEIKGLKYLETENVTNMYGMFSNNASLSLDLSSFDTSKVTNMIGMFDSSAATTIDLSNFDTSKVTNMIGMFEGSAATTIDLSSFDTSKVTDMSSMFSHSAATTINLSGMDASSVTDMSYMFSHSAATTINLSGMDASSVTDMSWMFDGSAAATINLSGMDTRNVTNMRCMFMDSLAATIDLSGMDTSSVTDMGWMFFDSAATTLDLSSFDTGNVTDMNNMFLGANATTGYARTQEEAEKFNDPRVTSIPSTLTFVVKSSTN